MAIISVKNLIISFKTNNGTVKAVRDISFDIEKGQTLAVVGESGSGKSVTVRAIMGILAGNAIVEGGEIIYDGMDLLKIPEEEFHHIRGNKISMIFQDPLSSLNPIIKIGKQLTEAMILNGKANQREAKIEFKGKLKILEEAMNGAYAEKYPGVMSPEEAKKTLDTLVRFVNVGNKAEAAYNAAIDSASTVSGACKHIIIEMINGEPKYVSKLLDPVIPEAGKVYNMFLIPETDAEYKALIEKLKAEKSAYKSTGKKEELNKILKAVAEKIDNAMAKQKPNFFTLGYRLMTCPNEKIQTSDIEALDNANRKLLDDEFMSKFLLSVSAGVKYSYDVSIENKKKAVTVLKNELKYFIEHQYTASDKSTYRKKAETLADAVENGIDKLDIDKDSYAYTFRSSFNAAMETYLHAKDIEALEKANKRIPKSERGFASNMKLDLYCHNIQLIIEKVISNYENLIEKSKNADFSDYGVEIIDYIKEKASKMVYKVTKNMAKNKAISLMEEVGIPEPRKRFKQYPFQFSGGMRQRIVIAIALAANPDILICDEPTTALDVTIQAQILDLINNLKKERKLTVIFITHDLGVVANMADQIAVMYAGKIVEYGTSNEVFYEPAHPYTWALLSSMPDLDTKEKLEAIPGTPPNMIFPPKGDAFAARNKYALQIDFEEQPPFFEITPTHKAATWLLHPDAPKVEPPRIVTERIERMKKYGGNANG